MPPTKRKSPRTAAGIALAGVPTGLVASLVIYVVACTLSFKFTGGGQDPTNFMVVIFGWIPSLALGVPLGILAAFRMGDPPKSPD